MTKYICDGFIKYHYLGLCRVKISETYDICKLAFPNSYPHNSYPHITDITGLCGRMSDKLNKKVIIKCVPCDSIHEIKTSFIRGSED